MRTRKFKFDTLEQKFEVKEHIVLKNFWEYYILTSPKDGREGVEYAYVMGFENEFGFVDLNEIEPYIASRTVNLNELMAPVGAKWIN